MFLRKKKPFKDLSENDDLAMRLAVLSETSYTFNRDECAHEIEFQEIAKIAKLVERIEQLEGAVYGQKKA